ncbi:MAG TPA: ATP-binding protein, partial [Povalibacter sp.]|nr:ATP-binding protein [Povalibacter sp.]
EARIAERTRRLEQTNRELESFSYTVSHDLRSPLQVIEGFSALALQEDDASVPHRTRDYLRRIQNGARRMHDMIGHLLTFSQLAGAQLEPGHICLSEVGESILHDLRVTDPARRVEAIVEPGMTVNADTRLIRNVLHNLLANAWKFTSQAERARIEFGRRNETGEWVYFVRDNGVGFAADNAQRLFQPFVRLHDKRDFHGNGVGLATARRIVERHGGRIWAESQPGQGATFFFTLQERSA